MLVVIIAISKAYDVILSYYRYLLHILGESFRTDQNPEKLQHLPSWLE